MSSRNVYLTTDTGRVLVGSVRKYVGATARTMGSDPAYVAHPADPAERAVACTTWTHARDYLIRLHRNATGNANVR